MQQTSIVNHHPVSNGHTYSNIFTYSSHSMQHGIIRINCHN